MTVPAMDSEKIDFQKDWADFPGHGEDYGVVEAWGRSIAERVESETIARCQTAQAFNQSCMKLERLYSTAQDGGKGE